ncbi:MAG: hypothetical protein O7H41_16845 [Planctomycetota bacterium]|nr:hypothetical protein [Planctomycetota bacterium]
MRGSVCGILLLLVFPLACSVSRSIQPPAQQSQAPVELHSVQQRETASETESELARLLMEDRVGEYTGVMRVFDTIDPLESLPDRPTRSWGKGLTSTTAYSLGHLGTRDKKLEILAGPDGAEFTVKTRDGKVVAAKLSELDLATQFPRLHLMIHSSHARPGQDWAGM